MNNPFSIVICLSITLCLLGAELVDSYTFANDIILELAETGQENPTEDCKDSELEFEVNILSDKDAARHLLSINGNLFIDHSKLLSDYCKDIPIPPPDHV